MAVNLLRGKFGQHWLGDKAGRQVHWFAVPQGWSVACWKQSHITSLISSTSLFSTNHSSQPGSKTKNFVLWTNLYIFHCIELHILHCSALVWVFCLYMIPVSVCCLVVMYRDAVFVADPLELFWQHKEWQYCIRLIFSSLFTVEVFVNINVESSVYSFEYCTNTDYTWKKWWWGKGPARNICGSGWSSIRKRAVL